MIRLRGVNSQMDSTKTAATLPEFICEICFCFGYFPVNLNPMKHYILLSLASMTLAFSACKKDDKTTTTNTPVTHVGIWSGKYGNGSSAPTSPYGMVYFTNLTMRAFDGNPGSGTEASGTYQIYSTDSIKGVYKYLTSGGSTYYFRGKLNGSRSHIDGTWGSDSLALDGGTFYLDK